MIVKVMGPGPLDDEDPRKTFALFEGVVELLFCRVGDGIRVNLSYTDHSRPGTSIPVRSRVFVLHNDGITELAEFYVEPTTTRTNAPTAPRSQQVAEYTKHICNSLDELIKIVNATRGPGGETR